MSRKTGSGRLGATCGVSIAVAEILDDLDKEAGVFPRFWGCVRIVDRKVTCVKSSCVVERAGREEPCIDGIGAKRRM